MTTETAWLSRMFIVLFAATFFIIQPAKATLTSLDDQILSSSDFVLDGAAVCQHGNGPLVWALRQLPDDGLNAETYTSDKYSAVVRANIGTSGQFKNVYSSSGFAPTACADSTYGVWLAGLRIDPTGRHWPALLRSDDTLAKWTNIAFDNNVVLPGLVTSLDAKNGVVAFASYDVSHMQCYLYSSTDSGKTWNAFHVPTASYCNSIKSIHILGDKIAVLVVGHSASDTVLGLTDLSLKGWSEYHYEVQAKEYVSVSATSLQQLDDGSIVSLIVESDSNLNYLNYFWTITKSGLRKVTFINLGNINSSSFAPIRCRSFFITEKTQKTILSCDEIQGNPAYPSGYDFITAIGSKSAWSILDFARDQDNTTYWTGQIKPGASKSLYSWTKSQTGLLQNVKLLKIQ
jgi:hypothetical protein